MGDTVCYEGITDIGLRGISDVYGMMKLKEALYTDDANKYNSPYANHSRESQSAQRNIVMNNGARVSHDCHARCGFYKQPPKLCYARAK